MSTDTRIFIVPQHLNTLARIMNTAIESAGARFQVLSVVHTRVKAIVTTKFRFKSINCSPDPRVCSCRCLYAGNSKAIFKVFPGFAKIAITINNHTNYKDLLRNIRAARKAFARISNTIMKSFVYNRFKPWHRQVLRKRKKEYQQGPAQKDCNRRARSINCTRKGRR